MDRWGWVLVVAAVFVLAGCLVQPGGSGASASEGPLSNASTTPVFYPDDAPSPDPSVVNREDASRALAGQQPQIDPQSISEDEARRLRSDDSAVVVVGVVNDANRSRNVSALVSRALSYWEANDAQYVGYEVDFELDPDADQPDVLVSFQPTVECQGETGWLGCAPNMKAVDSLSDTKEIAIKSGYTNRSTVRTIKHEFGHLFGIQHGEPPMPLMSPRQESMHLPTSNAAERAFPWRDRNLSVFVDYGGLASGDRMDAARQVAHALDYYQNSSDADRWGNVTFTSADGRSQADLLIDFDAQSPHIDDAGSFGQPMGPDVDGDGSVEYYTRSRIVVMKVRTDAIGWHVGYWIGVSLGARDETELPAPFRNGTRTGDWWD